jgi:alpha-glucosidase
MVTKTVSGTPVETGAVVMSIPDENKPVQFGQITGIRPFSWICMLNKNDVVYGLGESVRGINKRGFRYVSWCSDQPNQNESSESLYGAHNFLLVSGRTTFGIFFDTPSHIVFDIGWTKEDVLSVTTEDTGVSVYVITPSGNRTESSLTDIIRQFRTIIGRSYIPPRWAFGFQQSRWGYKTEDDVREVVRKYRDAGIPLDTVCLDIDYMKDYEDFTIDEKKFPDPAAFNAEMKKNGIHLVPIVDAGIKIKTGYHVYDEGLKNGYFCTKDNGQPYAAGVWPGRSHFADFLNPDARQWFGAQYESLTRLGFEGFWNDMNEPAMFYSDESLEEAFAAMKKLEGQNLDVTSFFKFTALAGYTFNRTEDYRRFYHTMHDSTGKVLHIRHDKVHNIFGSMMTRAAAEGLRKISPDKRMLLYVRASCIGAHRYGGIWTGDNSSWWGHLLQEIKMIPSLNMCGFLYSGADIGGFGNNVSRDLLLRWTAFGIFTPLMRNHSAGNTRRQECWQFERPEDFRSIVNLRYALIPYIYSEFVKAAVTGGMYLRPLAFDYPEDKRAVHTEDELLAGEGILIAPVYEQNADGRMVYLPEDMTQITWHNSQAEQQECSKGFHYIEIPLDTVVFFIKHDRLVPLCAYAPDTSRLDTSHFSYLGTGRSYSLYEDDGYTRNITLDGHLRTLER